MNNIIQGSPRIREVVDPELILDNAKLNNVMIRFEKEIKRGLKKETHHCSEVKCFVTYVQDLPNGNELGKFLALDLGGTNFRVLLIHLKGESDYEFQSKIYAIPQSIMTGSGDDLFDHIAECLAMFIKEMSIENQKLPLGFTFSFPCQQFGLTKGLLIKWTKGFNCAGVVDKNVVELLEAALKRRTDVSILVCAILNDTTGTLMSCAWKYRNCKIGVILGTGSNACYLEKVKNAELYDGARNGDDDYVIINTEWGAFGEFGSLEIVRTAYDHEVDKFSINPGNQLFEKMMSGMYMGELVRLVIVKLVRLELLFDGKGSEKLLERNQFFTKYVSEIESQEVGSYTATREIMKELGIENVTDQDCADVRYICECISRRAAHLVSAVLTSLILKMGDRDVTIGVDGSVYRFHPKFNDLMVEKIKELLPKDYNFRFVLSEDGSGRGAALVAAVASREVQ
ncbi:unnamed protein product [Diamesa serratosioi]